jgi:hypothetical protein
MSTYETVAISTSFRVRIEYDLDAESPAEWDNVGQIAYTSSRETLGTEHVSRERLDEIAAGIRDGSLIGLPVCAYIHGGATIRTTPFSCPWDSGQSGFVYTTREKAVKEFGKKRLTKAVIEKTLNRLRSEVEAFDQYLTGDVYGFIVERVIRDGDGDEVDTEELDSCWGFYGHEYAVAEGTAAGLCEYRRAWREALREARLRRYWAQRDVVTEGV